MLKSYRQNQNENPDFLVQEKFRESRSNFHARKSQQNFIQSSKKLDERMCRASKIDLIRIKDQHRDNSVEFLPDLQS